MKFNLLIFVVILFACCTEQVYGKPINFVTKLNSAIKMAKKQDKLIFVYFDKEYSNNNIKVVGFFENDEKFVDYLNEHFVCLRANKKNFADLSRMLGFIEIEEAIILDRNSKKVVEISREIGNEKILTRLKLVNENKEYLKLEKIKSTPFSEEIFLHHLSKLVESSSEIYANTKIQTIYKLGEPYNKAVLKYFPNKLDFKSYSKFYKNVIKDNDTILTEYLLEIFLKSNMFFDRTKTAKQDIKMLCKLTKLTPDKIISYLTSHRAINFSWFQKYNKDSTNTYYCKKLLLNFPETRNTKLLYYAFIEVIKVEKDTSFYKSILPIFSSIYSNSPMVEHHDMLSVVYYLLGQKKESVAEIVKANSIAFEQKAKYKPLLNFYRELFESSNNLKTGN